MTDYQKQAEHFLEKHRLTFHAELMNTKTPPWSDGKPTGHHYLIEIGREQNDQKIKFDFWDSIHNAQTGKEPTAYDVLACISGDMHMPDTFEEFCLEYGYDADSRKAERTFKAAYEFCQRLQQFFSVAEAEELAEIR